MDGDYDKWLALEIEELETHHKKIKVLFQTGFFKGASAEPGEVAEQVEEAETAEDNERHRSLVSKYEYAVASTAFALPLHRLTTGNLQG